MELPYARSLLLIAIVAGLLAAGAATTGIVSDDSSLSIERMDESKPAAADVAFEVEATLDSTHDEARTRLVTLLVDLDGDGTPATTVAVQSVTVPAEGSIELSLEVPAATVRPGTYEYALVVGDDDATSRGNVSLRPTAFAIDNATAPAVVRGERGRITATVHNAGDYQGTERVRLQVDRDHDGDYESEEVVGTTSSMVSPRDRSPVVLDLPTDELAPGIYDYRLVVGEASTEGRITVMQPATLRIDDVDAPKSLTRGETLTVNATVSNDGDVPGSKTVDLEGPASTTRNESITLAAGESTTVAFTVETANLTRGNYTPRLSVANDTATVPLRVRDSHLEVVRIDGPETVTIDDDLQFTATVRNAGDAPANQTIEYRIDLDDDDEPESYGLNRTVTLAPGNETTVQFTVPYGYADDPIRRADVFGTHIYGIYSEDTEVTSVVVVTGYSSSTTVDGTSSTSDDPETVSLSEISQQKYGYDYDEISGETKWQIEELHERQPFADGLVINEVLTREEIARQQFGLDVETGDNFNFTALPVETQQDIEAVFDAQFQSDEGDRVESWDELAQQHYGSDYEDLTDSRQQTIRDRYWEQFEDES